MLPRTTTGRLHSQIAVHNFIEGHLDIRDVEGLAFIDIALGGRLAAELDRLRENGATRLDVQIGGGPGAYVVLLHGLSEHHEVVVGSSFIWLDEDLDEDAKLVVLGLHLSCIQQKAEREQRRMELRASRRTTVKPADYQIGHSPSRRKG